MFNTIKNNWKIFLIVIFAALLRLVALNHYPVGLNADEAAIGYNAWSLIHTGRDEHGAAWPLAFRSFDDYKPPLYFYTVLPFIQIFGLNIWSVRLPAAFFGIASVYLIYVLTKILFRTGNLSKLLRQAKRDPEYSEELNVDLQIDQKPKTNNFEVCSQSSAVSLLAALLLAISPWHLQFTRGGWEVNVSTFFILLGVYAFLKSFKNTKYFYVFTVSMALSLFTYHSARIVAPLLSLSLIIICWKKIFRIKDRHLYISVILGVIIALPIIFQLMSKEGQSRFTGVSFLSDSGPLSWVHEMRRTSANPDSLITKFKYNKYFAYSGKFLSNYFSHFNPKFLFISGDIIDRSRVPGVGESLSVFIPFFYLGLIYLIKPLIRPASDVQRAPSLVILSWTVTSPIAAALTYQSPHALRAENMVISLSIITAIGLLWTYSVVRKYGKPVVLMSAALVGVLICYQFSRYLYSYYYLYPLELPASWQYGFDQIAEYVAKNQDKYDKIIITDRYDQPYILMAFYLKYPPDKFQKEIIMTPRDKFGFSTVRNFDKYEFKKIDYSIDGKSPNTLIISADESVPAEKIIYQIHAPGGEVMYNFVQANVQK